ncbi:MAG: polyprenyl synthetase family protein [Holophagaceae bacterium]|nr:polyprenyl synthetase family protein [Holophagaceae bacterium]
MNRVNLNDLFIPVAQKLDAVEEELKRLVGSDIPVVGRLSEHVSMGSGKRLRPGLLLLAAKFCGCTTDEDVRFAAIVELVHTATLIHDDIIDHAQTRRGLPTLNAKWGNTLSVLFGDFLSLRSMGSAIQGRNWRMLEIISDVASRMVEGELIQNDNIFNVNTSRKAYFEIIERKTACLFAACAEAGAVLAGRDDDTCRSLSQFGLELGRAFQMVDDLLDYISTSDQLGKPVFSDLQEGKLTLPTISLMEKAPDEAKYIIDHIWANDFTSSDPALALARDIQSLTELMKEHGTLDETRELAIEASATAAKHLPPGGDSEIGKLLKEIPGILIERTY